VLRATEERHHKMEATISDLRNALQEKVFISFNSVAFAKR